MSDLVLDYVGLTTAEEATQNVVDTLQTADASMPVEVNEEGDTIVDLLGQILRDDTITSTDDNTGKAKKVHIGQERVGRRF